MLHVPSIAAVVAGDVTYNGINPFLAELEPRVVVAGHKRPEPADDELGKSVRFTRDHIADFITEDEAATGSRDLVERIQRRYPDLGNPSALVLPASGRAPAGDRTGRPPDWIS